MCGRAAQTRRAVRLAEDELLGRGSPPPNRTTTASRTSASRGSSSSFSHRQGSAAYQQETESDEWQDNYNMSPGMSCTIFFRDDNHKVQVDRKVWGLVPSGGTRNKPLPTGKTLHFEKLMFNARSDTLLDKYSFAPLFGRGRTCILVVDGFFEWKPAPLKGGKKQPYFVYQNPSGNARPYLMFAGLWTSVPTGRTPNEMLDTFTIITTEACDSLSWLHSRMPLTIYDEELARQWLERPSRELFKRLDEAATPPDYFQWHAVTTEMNSTKYRSKDAIKAVPPPPSVKSFFSVVKKDDKEASSVSKTGCSSLSKKTPSRGGGGEATLSVLKRSTQSAPEISSPPAKKHKSAKPIQKGSIASFFLPKPKK